MSASEFDPGAYGRKIAARYDETSGLRDPTDEVALLSELAGSADILEFGIGTGRLALPLIGKGFRVAGIEGSAEMVELLRAKPGGDDIDVRLGDFSEVRVPGRFGVVMLVMNTVYALPTQDAQVACFANAAAHLAPGGFFVVDAWIPDPGAFRDGRALRVYDMDEGGVVLEAAEIAPATQFMRTNKIFLRGDSVRVFPANHRYAWPAELDLMARLAGMELAHRWGDWRKTPYDDRSRTHVSVWRKP